VWENFYAAGGWGMHPTSIFGFFLVAASALYALRPRPASALLIALLSLVTFGAGLLGTVTGICQTLHYLEKVEPAKQLSIMALGIEESLHNIVLALILIVLGGVITVVGVLRSRAHDASSAAA
jgi:hypothetical protein